jgi:mono/diheme cytochrome c family protein
MTAIALRHPVAPSRSTAMIPRPAARLAAMILPVLLLSGAGSAQEAPTPVLSPAATFAETDGAALFANVCQACHMPAAQGAIGAGHYPAWPGTRISRPAPIRSMSWCMGSRACRRSAR